jgi:glycerol-3-phosphate dehydrogenase
VAADLVAAIIDDADDVALVHTPGYSSAELRHLALTEDAVHLDDLLMRRTSIAFVGGATEDAVGEIAAVVAPVLGWDAAHTAAEVERAIAKVHAADPSWAEASATSR